MISLIPTLSLAARRFNDVGLSSWWTLLYLVSFIIGRYLSSWLGTVINVIILVIFMLPTDHLKESNELIDE